MGARAPSARGLQAWVFRLYIRNVILRPALTRWGSAVEIRPRPPFLCTQVSTFSQPFGRRGLFKRFLLLSMTCALLTCLGTIRVRNLARQGPATQKNAGSCIFPIFDRKLRKTFDRESNVYTILKLNSREPAHSFRARARRRRRSYRIRSKVVAVLQNSRHKRKFG
jgi:hypothetical protein